MPFTIDWAVVERALDGDVVDVRSRDRRHLPPLHFGDAPVGEEDEDVDRSRPRNASIAAEPVSPEVAPTIVARLAALGEDMVHEAGEELHRHVLEGERRAVEQLQHEMVRPDLHKRRDRFVAEGRVSVVDHPMKRLADFPAGKSTDDGVRNGLI